jgi:hypothetical protein
MPSIHPELRPADRETLNKLAILGAFACVLTAIAYACTISWVSPFPRDATTLVVGRDFLNFWMYGRAAAAPGSNQFYDIDTYQRTLAALVGPDYPGQIWSYPPSVMLLAAPFGQLGYFPALALWTALSLAIFLGIGSRHVERRVLIIVLMSPAAVLALMSGQNSLITAAMLVAIFAWLDRRPVGAGILIGLLTLKPQLGLLFPVILIASGRWRVFWAAAVTTLAIVAVTAALWGPQVWIEYVRTGLPVQNLSLLDPGLTAAPFNPTIFMNARVAGLSYGVAMALQGVVALGATAAAFWCFRARRDADPQVLMALFLACSLVVTPYLMSYDVTAMTLAVVALGRAGRLDTTGRRLAQLVYWLPLIQVAFGRHVPGPALVAPAVAVYLVMRLRAPAGVDAVSRKVASLAQP